MESEDNCLENTKTSKSKLTNYLITHSNSSSNKSIESNNIQRDLLYIDGNYLEKELEKSHYIGNKLESENDKKLDSIFIQDIINSPDIINSKSENNLTINHLMEKKFMKDNTESFENEKDSSPKKSKSNNNDVEYLKKNEDNIDEFLFNLNINKSSDFHMKNSLILDPNENNENEEIIHNNRYLNNNTNITGENEAINYWNFNISPSKIFNSDNQNNQKNNNQRHKFNNNNNNIYLKSDVNNDENSSVYKNKEITNSNEFENKEKLNIESIKINNEGYLEKKDSFNSFNENPFNKKFNIFQNQNNYINFDNKFYYEQNQNNYIQNNFMNKNNKIINNYFEQKDLNIYNFNRINKNKCEKDIIDNNNNFCLYNNNKIICYNNYINLINPAHQNKNINSIKNKDIITQPLEKTKCNDIPSGKDKDNLNHEDYIIKMFGKFGWICRICNNFNFESRCICNRCKGIKAPKTKEEINEAKKETIKTKTKKTKGKNKVWLCPNCNNINYSFRKFCNRCKIERKKEFPSILLEAKQKSNGKNNNIFPMRGVNEIGNCLNKNLNIHINNNILYNANQKNYFERNCFKSFYFNNNN